MAPTWNGFLDSSLCQDVCHSASSQNCQARYQLGKHLENCNLLEKQVGMRQNRALMYTWHSGVELSIPKFDRLFLRMQLISLQRSATKAANQLQGWGEAHLRKARTAAWDTRDLKLTRSPPLHPPLLPFQEAHPEMPPPRARTGDRDTAGTAAGADPNLPQPRAAFQPQCHPGLCSQLWQWCLLPSPPARAASPRCKFTATPADEARRARKYLLGDCVMGLVLQLLMAKSVSSLPA